MDGWRDGGLEGWSVTCIGHTRPRHIPGPAGRLRWPRWWGRGRGNISIDGAAAKQMHRNEKGAEDEKKEGKERKGELQWWKGCGRRRHGLQ